MIRRRREIIPGQRYRKLGFGAMLWEVVGLSEDALGNTHVRLRQVGDPRTLKTLAASVLDDPSQFQLVA
ncbi:hypothetical protein [Aerophototrophica crusticola]|uniref:hypothetical protein n=1 Tax=Aerophototrophica crusticola TaxID=1709002 RepID=UPI000A8340BE